jgi:3'-5' exonuclease
MIRLFFDIETIPCDDEHREQYLEILQKKYGNDEKSEEEIVGSMSFDGTFGRIFCIGYIKDDGVKQEKGMLRGDEKEILRSFWKLVEDVNLYVGHNVLGFDFPFIYKRSVIIGVKPSINLSLAKFRSFPIFDTQKEWSKWADNGASLDTVAKILGLPTSKDKMDGSMVWPYFQQGRLDEICEYCMKDVEVNRKVYYKMIFENPPEGNSETTEIPF